MWDTHCHLADFQQSQLDTILATAKDAGVNGFITSSASFADFNANIKIASENANVFFTLGLHPLIGCDFLQKQGLSLNLALQLLQKNVQTQMQKPDCKLVAIGEIGLDFRHKPATAEKNMQKELFRQELELAKELKLPVVIHVQKAQQEVMDILIATDFAQGGIIHAFNSGINQAKFYSERGFKLGIGTSLLNPKASNFLSKIKQLDLQDMVLESDSPYAFTPNNQINNPANIALIRQKLADEFALTLDFVNTQINQNTKTIFIKRL